jgi:hypothetical protein
MKRCTFLHKPLVRAAGTRMPRRVVMVTSLAAVLLLTLLAAPALAAFSDVPQSHSYYTAIEGMAARDIIGGYPDGTYRPDEPVLRAQFAKMIDGTMDLTVTEGGQEPPPFTDLGKNDPTNLYPHDYVAAAYWANITTGKTATTFAPWDAITRAQMVTMTVRAANSLAPGVLDPVPAGFQPTIPFFSDIHSPLMDQAEANGLLAGLVGFSSAWDPLATATRGECAQVLWNLLGKMEEPPPPPPSAGPFPSFAELKPTAPIGYTVSLDLSDATAAIATTIGVPGPVLAIPDMVVTGHVIVQIVSVTQSEATLSVTLDQITLPPALGSTDLSASLPIVLTVVLSEDGSVQSIGYSSAGGPAEQLNAQEIAQLIPLIAPLTEVLFVPNLSALEKPGDSVDSKRSYSIPGGGAKLLDLDMHATFESLADDVAVVSFSLSEKNINTTIIVDIMPLLQQLLNVPAAPGQTAILVLQLTGTVTTEGRIDVDTTTGLPVAVTAASVLDLRAGIQNAPPELAALVPGFDQVSAIFIDADLGAEMARE